MENHDVLSLVELETELWEWKESSKGHKILEGGCCAISNESWDTFALNSQTYYKFTVKFIFLVL